MVTNEKVQYIYYKPIQVFKNKSQRDLIEVAIN